MGNVKISFTGDVMCEYTRLESFQNEAGYDFTPLFSGCREIFRESDYVVANLETPVAGESLRYSYKNFNFNTPEAILSALASSGVDMVTTANNHVLDRGVKGIDNTVDNIRKYGLDFTGTARSGEKPLPLIKEIGGLKIGFLSYTYGTEACYNGCYLRPSEQYRVNLLRNQELYNRLQRFIIRSRFIAARAIRFALLKIKPEILQKNVEDFPQKDKYQKKHILDDIAYCKNQKCDLIIMCLHSGGQFNDEPTEYTKGISEFCRSSGVDVVVGNHEHLIQHIDAEKRIAYCLGNFTSDYSIDRAPYDKDANCSVLLHLNIDEKLNVCFSFSIMLSKKNDDGKIVTVPLFDEYRRILDSGSSADGIVSLNTRAYNRFCKTNLSEVTPEKEYCF